MEPVLRIGEKIESKREILVEENGVPPSPVIVGTSRRDPRLLEPWLKQRFQPVELLSEETILCLDAGFVEKKQVVIDNNFTLQVRPRGEEKKALEINPSFQVKRRIVEACNSRLKHH